MIDFDFEYHRPDSVGEAAQVYRQLRQGGKRPVYYGGGTEVITRARTGELRMGAVVDLKRIPELRTMDTHGDRLALGAALTLAEMAERAPWELLNDACGRVADHTVRCQITLGGNLAGTIPYREAALPFWLAEGEAEVAGPDGTRRVPFTDVFDGELHLGEDEFLSGLLVDRSRTRHPHVCTKRTRLDWVDYPLCTLAAIHDGTGVRVAIAGVGQAPWRHRPMEDALNERGPSREVRVERALEALPGEVVEDLHGSRDYRRFVLGLALDHALSELEG